MRCHHGEHDLPPLVKDNPMRKRLLPLLAVLVVAAVGIGVWVGLV